MSQADLITLGCEKEVFKDSVTEPEEQEHRNGGRGHSRNSMCEGPEAAGKEHSRSESLKKASMVSGRRGKGRGESHSPLL